MIILSELAPSKPFLIKLCQTVKVTTTNAFLIALPLAFCLPFANNY